MRSRALALTVVALTMTVLLSPMQEMVSAQSGSGIVISEYRFRGPAGINDEFVEIFNAGSADVNIGGWMLRSSNNNIPPLLLTRATVPAGTVIPAGCFYLFTNSLTGGFSGGVTPDRTFNVQFGDDGGVAITTTSPSVIVDQAGHGSVTNTTPLPYFEGTRLPGLTTNENRSFERLPGGALGHADTNNNAVDFHVITPSTPRNSSTSSCLDTAYLPHQIQGAGAASPFAAGTTVTVRGVVTGRKSDGFFVQTDPSKQDADPNTSEGLFVFTAGAPPASAMVGHLVNVRGAVAELVPASDPGSAPLTSLQAIVAVTDLGVGTMPAAYVLTTTELSDAGALDQLERFEGMRVTAPSLLAVSGTGGTRDEANASSTSDGAFFAVLTDYARTFRGPGVEAGYPVLPCAIGPCNIPLFDGNPERVRVDSDGLEGLPAVDLSTGAVVTDVTGPLDFASRAYTILAESPLTVTGGMLPAGVPAAASDQFTIASFNLDRFYDANDDPGNDVVLTEAAYQTRLAKASQTIRTVMNTPDIIGVQGVENVGVLLALANRVDADAAAAGEAAPQYAPSLFEGVDPDGLDVGFLVKQGGGRVSVVGLEQVGADATYLDPTDGLEHLTHDRPPVVLQALVTGPATSLPQQVTVIVNHLRSLSDVEQPTTAGQSARAKRQAQADFLAGHIQWRQSNAPAEAIVSLGDYNAYQFNDGYVDSVGTVRGNPAPPDQVATEAFDLVSPDLVDLGASLDPSERYSFVSRGNAQTFDHVLVSAGFASQFVSVAHARVNADFPDAWREDATTPARLSDRDPVVTYFTFPPDVDAPVFGDAPDQVAEATGPDGALVNFAVPTAEDNLDPSVEVVCTPASGSAFALGSTGVTCSAHDAAGNESSVAFSVTVVDTTDPLLLLPANATYAMTSPAGRVVNFNVTASDAVTTSPAVSCTPASGSTFPVGETVVTCTATDTAGNVATGSFTITITDTVFGRMAGLGIVKNNSLHVWFAFGVQESPTVGERGWVLLRVSGGGRNERFAAWRVTDVRFSYSGGVDTVVFSGVGYWNGRPGHRFEITATDRGEPGRWLDTFALKVFAPGGAVVESASGPLQDGNVQSFR
jgi:predicted extracellular nuclease